MIMTFFVSLAVLASGLAFVGPVAHGTFNPETANILFVLLRIVVMFVFSFIAVRRFRKNTYHALSYTGLLIFVDHVGIHSLWLAWQFRHNPGSWQGLDLTTILYNNAFAYIMFLAPIMMISFLGASAGLYLNHRQEQELKLKRTESTV